MSGAECPTCGRDDFASEQGMKAHHARSHGESLTTVVVECEVCGEEVEKDQHELENQEYVYCSKDCHYEHNSERYSGDGNPRSTLETVACANCGKALELSRWQREQAGSNRYFCDHRCQGEWRAENFSGEENPQWQEFPTAECEQCGQAYKIKPSELDRTRFCSNTCKNVWQMEGYSRSGNPRWKDRVEKICENCGDEYLAEQWEADERLYCSYECMHEHAHPAGQDHPRFNPHKQEPYYGPNWTEQRLKVMVRDQARCQANGCSNTTVDNLRHFGRELTAHHITPLESFRDENGEINYEVANDTGNLVAVCQHCHPKVDHGYLGFARKN